MIQTEHQSQHNSQLTAQNSGNLSFSSHLSKEDEEISKSALSTFRAKEEEIERKKMEVRDKVQLHLGRVEEETKRLAMIREELEAMADPMRKEVALVRKKIDAVNKELKPLGHTCQKKEREYKEALEAFNDKNKEKVQLITKLMELVSESERLRMNKLEELMIKHAKNLKGQRDVALISGMEFGQILSLDAISELRCTNASRLWKGLSDIWGVIKDGLCWSIRDGTATDFGNDKWLDGEGNLASRCAVNAHAVPSTVASMVAVNGDWDWNQMCQWLPADALEAIAAIKPPRPDAGADVPGWRWENNRAFSVRSAYKALTADSAAPLVPISANTIACWPRIWKLQVQQRVRVFLWLVLHQRIMTNVERKRRNLATSDVCARCQSEIETIVHVLRDCPQARQVWEAVVVPAQLATFFSLPFSDWILQCVTNVANVGTGDERWAARFATVCWLIWKQRCNTIFGTTTLSGSAWVRFVVQNIDGFFTVLDRRSLQAGKASRPSIRVLPWWPPRPGWVKANCDAAVDPRNNSAAIGGVIRDSTGSWIFGFSRKLGRCSVITAELWAMHDMLLHAWRIGFREVELETDNIEAYRIVSGCTSAFVTTLLIEDLLELMNRRWNVQLRHISRVQNVVADKLVALSRGQDMRKLVWCDPPGEVLDAL
ncbi:hypothetical protein V6N11_036890 [Hibiscus sabdariffa]|uniref:RAB6-interacting golgin n=1 Tax=Hibiscus sabdariffa TaxID=183260 RepID=A0ABR2RBU6_9ROSI